MPLDKSGSEMSIGYNIRKLRDEGYPPAQALAISLRTRRRARHEPEPQKKEK